MSVDFAERSRQRNERFDTLKEKFNGAEIVAELRAEFPTLNVFRLTMDDGDVRARVGEKFDGTGWLFASAPVDEATTQIGVVAELWYGLRLTARAIATHSRAPERYKTCNPT